MRRWLWQHEKKNFSTVIHDGSIVASDAALTNLPLPILASVKNNADCGTQSGVAAVVVGNKNIRAHYMFKGDEAHLVLAGNYYRLLRMPFLGVGSVQNAQADLRAEIPGKIIKIFARVGQSVAAGDAVLVQEAMKMEITLRAPAKVTVAEILVAEGMQVDADALLVRFQSNEGAR
ncbi:MAG: acetyl-CoA carboxylase biotin carboxyl carrier protein subunit [Spirochaetes bacterium]|nr:acetyl-CoA carboxylase biotin carboxyl carrier protein subunit [Spirochaetota bacterium]